jgi:hypothetical protein
MKYCSGSLTEGNHDIVILKTKIMHWTAFRPSVILKSSSESPLPPGGIHERSHV